MKNGKNGSEKKPVYFTDLMKEMSNHDGSRLPKDISALKELSGLITSYAPPDELAEKTSLRPREINFFADSALLSYAYEKWFHYNPSAIDLHSNNFFRLRISEERAGRKEFFRAMEAIASVNNEQKNDELAKKGFWERAFAMKV